MRLVLGASVIAALSGAPVAALQPVACFYDPAKEDLVDLGKPYDPSYLAIGLEFVGDGFVNWYTEDGLKNVVEHCASGNELTVRFVAKDHPAKPALNAMICGSTPYSLPQMAQQMRDNGQKASLTHNTYGNCACSYLEEQS